LMLLVPQGWRGFGLSSYYLFEFAKDLYTSLVVF
jgi:hypothetical protein